MGHSLTSVLVVARSLDGVHGFDVPSRRSLAAGARPPPRDPQDLEPGCPRQGWQHEASSRVEQHFRALDLFPRLTDTEKTMLRSEWSRSGCVLVYHSNPLTRPCYPLSSRICRCGRTIDHFGHHRAACTWPGGLARRGFAIESAVARIHREGGGVWPPTGLSEPWRFEAH